MSDGTVLRDGVQKYHAIIVGGGPAGCAAAIGLARTGARVLLLERQRHPAFKPGEVLAPSIRPALDALGLPDQFAARGSLALAGRLTVWDSPEPSEASGMVDPHGNGWLIDRADIEDWLIGEASVAGVTVARGAVGVRAIRARSGWSVNWSGCEERTSARAPLLLEATGRGPGVIGHGGRRRLDRLVALMAYVPAPPDVQDQRLIIEATADGWWYGALLPGRRAVLTFVTDASDLPTKPAARRARWNAGLAATHHVQRLIAGADLYLYKLSIRGFPAESSIRETLSGPGWVAIGEAAAAYDPLSGQGVVAAITKGSALARLVSQSTDISNAVARYAAAEREVFAQYTQVRQQIYARAARRFASSFWERYRPKREGQNRDQH